MKIIRVDTTPNPAALKFILEGSVGTDGTQAFQQSDAKNPPLVQKLFDQGATNVLLCQNFVSVALESAEDWQTDRPGVEAIINDHFASITGEGGEEAVRVRVIAVEETDYPGTRKFELVAPVTPEQEVSYDAEDDEDTSSPLAQALFKLGATEIELEGNHVYVTMFNDRAWEFFLEETKLAIEEHLSTGGAASKTAPPSFFDDFDKETFPGLPDDEKKDIIENLFDEMVRPALANDGGGLDLVGIEGYDVKIKYQGACGSCPSSDSGTLRAIDRCLKGYLHPDLAAITVSS